MTGPLTNVEKFAIQGMVTSGKDTADIAKELKRPVKTVQNYLDKLVSSVNKVDRIEEQPKTIKAKDLMVNKTGGKHVKGVSVMTPGASARGDEHLKNVPTQKSRTSKGAIWEIEESRIRE